jgi:hypothetical protein
MTLVTIFINHSFYVSYSSSSQCRSRILQTLSRTPDVLVRATLCGTKVQHGLALLGGSDTICNDLEKKMLVKLRYYSKRLVNLKFSYN